MIGYLALIAKSSYISLDAILEAAAIDSSITDADYKKITYFATVRAKELMKAF